MSKVIHQGKSHPDVARILMNMGSTYDDLGNYPKALEQYEAALKIYLAIHQDRAHPDVARTLMNMGSGYWHQAAYKKAEENYQRAYEMRKQCLSDGHPDTQRSNKLSKD